MTSSVENELMLTMDNLVGYKGDVTNDQADCGLVFVAQAKDGKVDAVKAELEAYKESLSANDLYAEFADKVALAKDARIVTNGNYVAIVIAGIAVEHGYTVVNSRKPYFPIRLSERRYMKVSTSE